MSDPIAARVDAAAELLTRLYAARPAPESIEVIDEEPRPGSVVALNWGGPHQEIWVANCSNVGNWYTPDVPLRGHPHWEDVVERARQWRATMTLLVAGDPDTYRAGYQAGISAVKAKIEEAIDEL
jgi:hypothetical protein